MSKYLLREILLFLGLPFILTTIFLIAILRGEKENE